MLPFIVLRRLECALQSSKDDVIARAKALEGQIDNPEPILRKVSGHSFYNTSPLDLAAILGDTKKVAANLTTYINSFSPSARDVLDRYGLIDRIKKLEEKGILYSLVARFADLDLNEETVSNESMGYIFEELLRRFTEMSNGSAGEHYTPREVIDLIVNLLFSEDTVALTGEKPVRTLYDPACGTGGMLTGAQEYLNNLNPEMLLEVFGQELSDETWAIARSDLMIKGQDATHITDGNSLTDEDGHAGSYFDYCISNPPYGVDWKLYQDAIREEAAALGYDGRYGAGLPPIDDGAFLFLQHMIQKMKPIAVDSASADGFSGGSRMAIVLPGSALQSGAPGSDTANIRRWIVENDWLEGVVAMPDQMFYNTKIRTYVWVLTNRKSAARRGKITLVDARDSGTRMRRSLGDKRNEILPEAIGEITNLYHESAEDASDRRVQIMTNEYFGFARIVVEQPIRRIWILDEATDVPSQLRDVLQPLTGTVWTDEAACRAALSAQGLLSTAIRAGLKALSRTDAAGVLVAKGAKYEADSALRSEETVPLPPNYLSMSPEMRVTAVADAAETFLDSEISLFSAEAWVDHSKTRVTYEIQLHREFHRYSVPEGATEVLSEIEALEDQIQDLLTRNSR